MQPVRMLTFALAVSIFVGVSWTAIARAQQTAPGSAADAVYSEAQATDLIALLLSANAFSAAPAELADAGRAAYRASQSRDRDAVSEVTNRIAEACLLCHEA